MALSGLSEMSAYLSAFGAKRTCRDCGGRIRRAQMTQRGHRTASHVAGANPGFALPKHSVELVRCRLLSQGADMRRREFLTILSGAAMAPLVWPDDALAQQPRNSPTIGFLGTTTPTIWSANVAAFQNRLRELGWIDGRNVSIEYRWAQGRDDRYAEFAGEFVQQKVDIIVTAGTTAVIALRRQLRRSRSSLPQQETRCGLGWSVAYRDRAAM